MNDLAVLVLAAGRSRRMRSAVSKVLHPVAGRPLIHYPVAAAQAAGASRVVVVTSPADRETIESYLASAFGADLIATVVQDPPRGTGDAARAGLDALDSGIARVLIICGDGPLVSGSDLSGLVESANGNTLALATCSLSNPEGYGRIVRGDSGEAKAIVEQRDLVTDAERAISEVNAGLYCVAVEPLRKALAGLSTDNAQGEYYLTDIVPVFASGSGVVTLSVSEDAMLGVNDRTQLRQAEDRMFERIATRHRLAGSTLSGSVRIDDGVTLGQDTRVFDGVHLRGSTRIGDNCVIDVGCVVTDATVESGTTLLPYTVVTSSHVGAQCQLGPFTHTRPGSRLETGVKLGNFVETKNTHLRAGAKANHLSYLGDGEVGEDSNIGAGTIFCNYDGFSKHRTVIGRGVFVGSDSQLIAPVTVGDGAYIATASSITDDVPADALAIGRVRQTNKEGRGAALRTRLKEEKAARIAQAHDAQSKSQA